jgi:hypothetical protein
LSSSAARVAPLATVTTAMSQIRMDAKSNIEVGRANIATSNDNEFNSSNFINVSASCIRMNTAGELGMVSSSCVVYDVPMVVYRSHAQHTFVPRTASVVFVTMHRFDSQLGSCVHDVGMSASISSLYTGSNTV